MQGFGFLWSHSDRIYTYLYGKTVYIRRLKFTYGAYEYGYGEQLFIHTYIYEYDVGQPYIPGLFPCAFHLRLEKEPTLKIGISLVIFLVAAQ